MILIVMTARREAFWRLVAEEAMWIGSHERDTDSRDRHSWRDEGEALVEVGRAVSGCGLAR
jgi:hypothetical protein